MHKSNNVILLIAFVVFIGGIGWSIARDRKFATRHSQGQKQFWYCPMHPWIKSDKPGACPICGMALVPGHKHNQEAPTSTIPGYVSLEISQQRQQLAAVRTATVTKSAVVRTIRAAGRVAYDPDLYEAEVKYVEDYIAFTRLDRRIDQGSYVIQDSKRNLKEEELDLYHMGATEQTIEQLQKNKFPDHSLLVSHGDGAQVFAEVFGEDLDFVDVGQKATIEAPDLHETFSGTVTSIDPIIDPTSQTARVRIFIDAPNDLHSNMFVNVSMPVEIEDQSIVIPTDAVMDTGLRKIVFVETKEGKFDPREIHTGWETDDGYQVKSGLKEGERIVISGNFLLDSESQVQASLQAGGQS